MFNISKLPGSIDIGYVGETNFRTIEIDMTPWMESNPDGVPSIVCIRPKEKKADAYVAATTFENNVLRWTITAGDIGSHEGTGEIQIWLEEEENETVNKRGKSVKVKTIVHDSASDPDGEVPAAQQAVLEQMTQLKNETVSAAEDAEDAKDAAEQAAADAEAVILHPAYINTTNKHWMVYDDTTHQYVDTEILAEGTNGAPGQDATPNLITKGYSDLTFPVTKDTLCYHSGVLYKAKQDISTSEAWTAAHWDETTIEAEQRLLKNAIQGKVSSQEMETCEKILVPGSKNLWNPQTMENGFVGTNGAVSSSDSYVYNFIDVMPGDKVYCSVAGTARNMRFICSYDENDDAQSTKGSGTDTNGFTVPDGIVRLAISVVSSIKDDVMILLNDSAVPGSYIAYKDPYYVYVATDAFMQNINAMTESYFQNKYMETVPKNILNPSDPDCVTKKLIVYSTGALSDNNDYYTTGFMPVIPGKTYTFWTSGLSPKGARAIAAYGSGKGVVSASGVNDGTATTYSYTVPNGIAYIRISFPYRTNDTTFQPSGNMVIASLMPESFMAYSDADEYILKEEFIPEVDNMHVYLPKEICVGVGRTIELYNELVCLEANKYHLRYVCSKGIQYERKFSITGATAGEYPLQLQIYDDNMKMVWTGNSTVKVVANNIANELKVLPIGDSLTNLKPWLNEVQSLSDSKILYIGTRGRSDQTIRCEGRSGFTAADYSANTSYTFDSNYQGNPNVDGSVNPFWDGSKFSLAYYNTQQSATVGTADAVQLFLGTNDVFGGFTAEESAQHIKALVDAIRADDATIPIFVCHTIYRSNQSGYYSSGGQGFTAASGWAFDSDMRIMKFQIALANALKSYTNLYIIPLSVCMDREYDYGVNAESVNPRLSTVTENIPTESVHPQEPGYLQIADVMYSSYIAHLS